MRSPSSRAILAASLIAGGAAAHADWKGTAELGVLLARGNAEATTGNVKLDMTRETQAWKHASFVSGLYGENAAFTTAERLEARWQIDYELSEQLFWFGAVRGERDRFSGFEYQASLSTGVGREFIDSETTRLSATLGAGYRRLRSETLVKSAAGEVLERIPGEVQSDPTARAGLDYEQQLTKTTTLVDKLLVEAGSSNTSAQNDFAVRVSMTDALALSVGYGIRYNTEPPPGAGSTDQLTTVNLVYKIR